MNIVNIVYFLKNIMKKSVINIESDNIINTNIMELIDACLDDIYEWNHWNNSMQAYIEEKYPNYPNIDLEDFNRRWSDMYLDYFDIIPSIQYKYPNLDLNNIDNLDIEKLDIDDYYKYSLGYFKIHIR